MARYDIESDVKFFEKEFESAQKYKESVAKKQDDFAKNLIGLSTIGKGINFLIDRAASENDQKQLPKKAAYQNTLTRTEKFRSEEEKRLASGLSVVDFLENQYFTQLNQEASQTFSQLNPAQYTKALREQAQQLALQNSKGYEELIAASKNIPDFENFDEYYKQHSDIPRNFGEWVAKGVRSVFRKETPETLKIKNTKASDALYGTEMFGKFENLQSKFAAYDALTSKGLDAVKIINSLDLKSGGLNKDLSKQESKTFIDPVKGTKTEITTFYGATNKLDGSGVEYRPENTIILDKRVSSTNDNLATLTEVEKIYDLAKKEAHIELGKILSNINGRPTFAQYQQAREFLAANPDMYSIDWQDEASRERAFPTWYSSQIIGVKNKNGQLIARDLDQDGIYEIDPKFREDAIKLGLDEKTLKEAYSQLGADASPKILDEDELITKTRTNFSKLVPVEFKDNYNELLTNIDSDFYDIIKIKLKDAGDKNIIDLGNLDVGKLFPNMGVSGVRKLYFNQETNELFY